MNRQPEPCLKDTCRSPTACERWGYCRERNSDDPAAPTKTDKLVRRTIAKMKRLLADVEAAEQTRTDERT